MSWDSFPKGIAADPATDRLFFGSMRTGDVYVLDAALRLSKFASVDAEGRLSAIGMTVDSARGLLWVVGTGFDLAENFDTDAPVETGVFGFDLNDGTLRERIVFETDGFGLNDVAVGPDGTVFASGGVLRKLDEDANALVPVQTSQTLFGTNGVAPHPDGEVLFASSYPVGVAAINLTSGDTAFLETPENITLYGIDGMYWHDGGLLAVQNGVNPWRLIHLTLDDDLRRVTDARIIELGNPISTPTTGAIVGDRIHLIGQGPDPDPVPRHFGVQHAQFAGPTVIRTAPLNEPR